MFKNKKKNKNEEAFLDHKTKVCFKSLIYQSNKKFTKIYFDIMQKTWEDAKTGKNCFMLYARSLYVTWGGREFWTWNSFKDTRLDFFSLSSLFMDFLFVCFSDPLIHDLQ